MPIVPQLGYPPHQTLPLCTRTTFTGWLVVFVPCPTTQTQIKHPHHLLPLHQLSQILDPNILRTQSMQPRLRHIPLPQTQHHPHRSMYQMLHHRQCFHIYHHIRRGRSSQCLQPIHLIYPIQHSCLSRCYHHNFCLNQNHLFHPQNHWNSLSRRSSAYTPSWRPWTRRYITTSSNTDTTNVSSRNSS